MDWRLLFNRALVKSLQVALEYEKKRSQELLELLQRIENRHSEALQYRSASFPTVKEEGWVETYDDLGQKVFIKPH